MKYKVSYIIQELQHQKWELVFIFDNPLEAMTKFEQIILDFPDHQFRYKEVEEKI